MLSQHNQVGLSLSLMLAFLRYVGMSASLLTCLHVCIIALSASSLTCDVVFISLHCSSVDFCPRWAASEGCSHTKS